MDIPIHTRLSQDQGAYDIALDRLDLVIFAPVDIWPASLASTVDYVSRLHFVKNFTGRSLVMHSDACGMDVFIRSAKQLEEVACDPTMLTPDEVSVSFVGECHDV